jgi:3-oxoacyl-[acyl-carrier-protein] synthase-3
MKIKIKAIAKYLPQRRYSSVEMDELAQVEHGKIERLTGVKYRHHLSEDETVCSMGAAALTLALENAGLKVNDIDLLLFAGASFDYPIPHNASIIKNMIADDEVNFHALDIDATCLSFINALDIAHLYLQSKRYQTIALVCSEVSSKALTPKEEMIFGLFGDAAVALILEASEQDGYEALYTHFTNYPSGAYFAHVPIGGAVNRGIDTEASHLDYYFKMNGKGIFRLATRHLDGFVKQMEEALHLSIHEIDYIIPHQTSKMGNEYFMQHFKIAPDRIIETLHQYGNCISASIPLGLEIFINQKLKSGSAPQKIFLLGTGAGVSIGGMVLEFS